MSSTPPEAPVKRPAPPPDSPFSAAIARELTREAAQEEAEAPAHGEPSLAASAPTHDKLLDQILFTALFNRPAANRRTPIEMPSHLLSPLP